MEAFPYWIIVLIVVIVLTRVGGLLARRLDIPIVTVQILIGILLGPSLLNLSGVPILLGTWGSPSPSPLHTILKILAEIGLIQLMFLAGLKVDWHELRKKLKPSFSTGGWIFLLTAVGTVILTRLFVDRWSEALAMSATVSASSFGISIYSFNDKKNFGSSVEAVVSGAALTAGLLAILLMIGSQAANYGAIYGVSKMTIAVSWFLAKLIMFFAVATFLTSRFLRLSAKKGFGKRPRQMLIGYLLLVASLYAWAAMHFGSFAAVGVPSLGGALLGVSNPEVKEKIGKGFGSILASIPIGILFMVIGMEVYVKAGQTPLFFLALLLAVVVATKLMGCWIGINSEHLSLREEGVLLFGILSQGEMGVLVAAYLFSRGVLSPPAFNVGIIGVVGLTAVSPILMRIVFSGFGIQTASVTSARSQRFNSLRRNP